MKSRCLPQFAMFLSVCLAGCEISEQPQRSEQSQPSEPSEQSQQAGYPGSTQSFPFDFTVTDVNGQQLSLSDFQGKVVIVDIWGTWCPPCRVEIPSFIKLQDTYGSQGFQMIGLNYENGDAAEARQTVLDFMAELGINYPCALGTDEIQSQVPDFEAFPTTILVDKTGKVREMLVGLHEYEELEKRVQALLAE